MSNGVKLIVAGAIVVVLLVIYLTMGGEDESSQADRRAPTPTPSGADQQANQRRDAGPPSGTPRTRPDAAPAPGSPAGDRTAQQGTAAQPGTTESGPQPQNSRPTRFATGLAREPINVPPDETRDLREVYGPGPEVPPEVAAAMEGNPPPILPDNWDEIVNNPPELPPDVEAVLENPPNEVTYPPEIQKIFDEEPEVPDPAGDEVPDGARGRARAAARVSGTSTDVAARERLFSRPSQIALAVCSAAALFAYHRLLEYDPTESAKGAMTGVEGFFFNPSVSSPTLLLVLAAWLIFRRHRALEATMLQRDRTAPATALGLALFAAGWVLGIWAHYVSTLGLLVPSISLTLLGGSLFLGGWRAGFSMMVPATFLILAYPQPAVALNGLMFPMQLMTAANTKALLSLGGIPTTYFGDLIYVTGGKTFQVIESCAGLRSTETLIMAAVVYNEVFARVGRRALIIVAVSPIVGVLVNHIRVLSITLNPYSALASVHTAQGIAMLVLGVLILAGIDELLGRFLQDPDRRFWTPKPFPRDTSQYPRARIAFCTVAFALLGLATLALPPWEHRRSWPIAVSEISPKLGGDWKAEGLPLDEEFMGSVGFTGWMHRMYTRDGDAVAVFVGSDERLDQRMSLVSGKNTVPGPGFQEIERSTITLPESGLEVERRILANKRGRVLSYMWYTGVDAFPSEVVRSAFALDRGPLRRDERAFVARVTVALPRNAKDEVHQDAVLAEVAEFVASELARIEPRREEG